MSVNMFYHHLVIDVGVEDVVDGVDDGLTWWLMWGFRMLWMEQMMDSISDLSIVPSPLMSYTLKAQCSLSGG